MKRSTYTETQIVNILKEAESGFPWTNSAGNTLQQNILPHRSSTPHISA